MYSSSLYLFIIFMLKVHNLYSLYEDQIGKFDWTKNLIGPVEYATFVDSTSFSKTLFVATKENVVASLSVDTGEIIWRKILEKGTRGRINTFCSYGHTIYAVTGSNVILVRGWDAKYGYLIYQWNIDPPLPENVERILWHCEDNKLYRLLFTSEQFVQLISWKIQDGEKILQQNIPYQETFDSNKCAISNGIVLCSNQPNFIIMNFTSLSPVFRQLPYMNNRAEVHSVDASLTPGKTVFTINTNIERFSLMINDNLNVIESDSVAANLGDISLYKLPCDDSVIAVSAKLVSESVLEVKGYVIGVMKNVFLHRFDLKTCVKKIEILAFDCAIQVSGQKVYSLLLGSYDGSLIFVKSSGELKWIREEGLANIVFAEIIELPMSDTEAEMQNEFDSNESNAFKMFIRRFSSHALQFQKLMLGIFGMLEKSFSKELQESDLVRDYFNLHKIILIINKQLKIFAIDNVSRRILWTHLVDNSFEAFPSPCTSCEVRIPLFIQRTYRHYPHPMLCTLLIRDKITKNGVILSFNPLSGIFQPVVSLDFKIKQAMLLPQETSDDHLQGIMILKEDNSVFVYPKHAISVIPQIAHSLYIYAGDVDSCEVNGYTFGSDIRNMSLVPAWTMKCAGKIIKILGKNPIEKVHSQGRVMADRSVLYKYINPNLIVIVSQSINAEDQKSMLSLYFVDSVTGVIVNGDVRHRASDPVHAIHSENWIILMYFNDKAKRTEIVTYELYEGKTQKNSTAFSSMRNKLLRPTIDSRAYILPSSHIEAAAETITEKGITSKQILVAVGTGNIIELPWVILDPRRPYVSASESKEEGILPYMPEIPVPTERIINYNITLNRMRGIVTSPSGLESTSLIFAYGLDLFYTRTAPSKTFDLLKEDFDYVLIIIVLVLLVILTCFTKHLAYRRALRQVWR